jgi:Ca2+-binding EF-hand superfamily protein
MLLDSVSQLHGFLGQKNVRKLLRETNYNRRELYVIFARFKALCAMSPTPAGINKETFKKGVARLAVEDDLFVDRVFNLVDQDGSGQIEWAEFLSAMSALEKGNPDVKNRFCFQAYDLDEDGFIGREDLAAMFSSSSMLKADQTTRDVVDAFVERVFKLVGVEAKGKIGLEDLHNYMRSRPEGEDVWDIFGRSMLKDFGTRPAQ